MVDVPERGVADDAVLRDPKKGRSQRAAAEQFVSVVEREQLGEVGTVACSTRPGRAPCML